MKCIEGEGGGHQQQQIQNDNGTGANEAFHPMVTMIVAVVAVVVLGDNNIVEDNQ